MVVREWLKLGASIFFLLLTACSNDRHEVSQLSSLSPDSTILAYGDSLTYGLGAKGEQAYPSVLEGTVGVPVVNAGEPGELSRDGLKRLPVLLEEAAPDLVILMHGGNDMLQRHSLPKLKANLRKMIVLCQERDVEVVLIGVPKPGLPLRVPELYSELANEMGVPLEQEVLIKVLSQKGLKSDRVHPNAKGYALMARSFEGLLVKAGAL